MTPDALLDYCLVRPGAFLDYPFGPGVAVVKVKAPSQERGPVFFQLFELDGEPRRGSCPSVGGRCLSHEQVWWL